MAVEGDNMLGELALLKTRAMITASTMLPMLAAKTASAGASSAAAGNAQANSQAEEAFKTMASPITGLLNAALTPLITVVGAAGALYCVLLGAKYAKAEEPQDREKAKKSLQNAIVGFLLIFVLLAALKVGLDPLMKWYSKV